MTDLTWDELAYSLECHLAQLPEDRTFILYVDESGGDGFDPDMDDHPCYVQFCAYGPGMVRCEVVGNTYLPPNMRHSVDDLVSLRMMGWRLPAEVQNEVGDSGSPNLFMDVHADETARAAEATITTFREIWGVASPDGIVTDAEMLRGRHAFRSCVRPVPEAARI